MKIDMSLSNAELYDGCEIEEVAGRKNLTTPVPVAVSIIGRNIENLIAGTDPADRDAVTLTGPMAVWAYLVVFHSVVHRFREVRYDDGRTGEVVIAKHG